jgi:hypothetical protein
MRATLTRSTAASLLAAVVVLLDVAGAQRAQAVEALSAAQLGELCALERSATAAITPCRTYVLGFLEGAIATDPRVALGVTEQIEKEDSFQARAYRTRLGRDLERLGPSHLAGFCVPKEIPLGSITTRVVESLPATPADEPAGELVYRVLRSNYPCKTADE